MHELSVARRLVESVATHAGDAHVVRVVVHVGKLSSVVPAAIVQCFAACIEGTRLEGAALDVIEVDGRARCRACDATSEARDLLPTCACGSVDLEIVSGRDLVLAAIEVR